MGENKRETSRINKSFVVMYRTRSDAPGKWDVTTAKEISETGMRFTSKQGYPCGEMLEIMIKIPFRPAEWLKLAGEVVWNEELYTPIEEYASASTHIVGLKFTDLKEEEKNLVKAYVSWFLTQRHKR